MKKPGIPSFMALSVFAVFVLLSVIIGIPQGISMGRNFLDFLIEMVKILPCVFILIGLFEVWVSRETVERHLGARAGFRSYIWAILLAGTTVGGLHVALPVAHALKVKGARTAVILAYLFSACVCRIPMTLFEASFMGWKFTGIRFLVSLPLIVLASSLLGRHLDSAGYEMPMIPKTASQG